MKTIRASWIAFAALALVSTAASGAAQRTFVASNGADSNPCSITQPCRTFGVAIAKTLPGGEVIVHDSAGYGVVTITQPVSLIAPQGIYAGVSVMSGQNGVTINAAGATVVLRGLSINGLSGSVYGIDVINAARVRIEGCTISNLGSIGIVQGAAGAETVLLDTIVRDNGGRGFSMITDATAVFDNVRVEHNGGDGIYFAAASSRATATIRRSVLSHNAAAGVAAILPTTSPTTTALVIEDSMIVNNGGDGIFIGGVGGGGIAGAINATVRRNSIAHNAYSGISAFAPSSDGVIVNAAGNTFADNPSSHIKADGSGALSVWASGNVFDGSLDFDTASAAKSYTFQDNTGVGGMSHSGTAPINKLQF